MWDLFQWLKEKLQELRDMNMRIFNTRNRATGWTGTKVKVQGNTRVWGETVSLTCTKVCSPALDSRAFWPFSLFNHTNKVYLSWTLGCLFPQWAPRLPEQPFPQLTSPQFPEVYKSHSTFKNWQHMDSNLITGRGKSEQEPHFPPLGTFMKP